MNLLTRLSRVIYRRAVPDLIGIKIKEFVALVYLRESGRATQQKLAETMMMDANNCVILLNGLEDEGLIARTRDPQDRRRHIVEITQKATRPREGGAGAAREDECSATSVAPSSPAARPLSQGARGPLAAIRPSRRDDGLDATDSHARVDKLV